MGFNTFPCNPYPISTEELNKGNNDDLNTRVTALEGDVSDLEEQKANQITIALSFNPETTYNPGDLVYYNGLTYRCTNEHAGEWDADDFAGTTIANELSELKSGLTHLESGTETFTDLTAGSNEFVTVYFGRAYTSAPIVMATIDADGVLSGASCAVRDITTTTAKIYARNSGASDATIKVNWGAIGI